MFRCKECGLEYNVKPDYCDCGNDVFEEVAGGKGIHQSPKPQDVQAQHQQKSSHRTFEEQYPELVNLKQSFDPISTVVFGICLILAIIVLFFVGNPEDKPAEQKTNTNKQKSQVVQNIPSIDTFWNSATVGIINNEKTLAAKYAGKNVNVQPSQPTQAFYQPTSVQQQATHALQQQSKPQQPVTTTSQSVPAKTQQTPKQNNVIANLFNKNNTTQSKQSTKLTTQTKTGNTNVNKTANTKSTQTKPNIPKTTQSIASGTNSASSKKNNMAVSSSNQFQVQIINLKKLQQQVKIFCKIT
jgi:hypothetical protein